MLWTFRGSSRSGGVLLAGLGAQGLPRGLGFRVQGLGFRAYGLGFRVYKV